MTGSGRFIYLGWMLGGSAKAGTMGSVQATTVSEGSLAVPAPSTVWTKMTYCAFGLRPLRVAVVAVDSTDVEC